MTILERVRKWLGTFPDFDILSAFQVDYTDTAPANAGLFPAGLVEVSRAEDVLGNVTVVNQYNFGIYCVLEKAAGDDVGATINADWVIAFQQWVQEQAVTGRAPVFGDEPKEERVAAQNGALFETGGGTGVYMVQLSVRFVKKYEVV